MVRVRKVGAIGFPGDPSDLHPLLAHISVIALPFDGVSSLFKQRGGVLAFGFFDEVTVNGGAGALIGV